ncbi:YbhB/YbcL family Raf kinase inhibitor-like protein [Methanomassiliicoccus luminyensis]|uniref:YbhB/YbcL family Raf kinase inhibitor-like protein n=1 Tax=Methanomassiliicoccus luminyensis TaxID=1080712 RepID=UPI00037F8379|nr:YbhB/YbcL family Raf kinase inhibitor-like protein [Methanomassiliicoccus luminyensis]
MKRIEEEVAHMPRQKGLEVSVESGELKHDEVCEGTQYSPQIVVGNLRAPFLAVVMDDVDASQGSFVHWLLWNVEKTEAIPRNLPKKEEIERPVRGRQGRNSFGDIGYTAPCPPKGARRRYRFRVYGLNEALELDGGSTGRDLERALEGHILQYGEAFITYERPMPAMRAR